ncbi:hypothetical protein R5W24_000543 [Gemmata sp. JC717]|uniref:hypothetical protein n=1 Tax=Gemmata algarum TaxID=2975278 RepID=UPI0021BACC80|nr:hypothetical protein [Gemmata algarum]MDY3551467.1 hypothetical protein [Gemmata algarum]
MTDPQTLQAVREALEYARGYVAIPTNRYDREYVLERIDEALALLTTPQAAQEEVVERAFEEWANLPPKLPTDKDGDGDYEDALAKRFYAAFEAGFRKGAWHGAVRMQELCAIDYDKLAVLQPTAKEGV